LIAELNHQYCNLEPLQEIARTECANWRRCTLRKVDLIANHYSNQTTPSDANLENMVRGASAMDAATARVLLPVHYVQNFPDTWSHSQVEITAPISPSARRTAAHTKAELKFASWNRQ
jgi:hypothetical protein